MSVPFLDVHSDAFRADPDAVDTDVDELLQPLGAVRGVADDPEAPHQLVARGLPRVELELARLPAGLANHSARGFRNTFSIVSTA